MSVIEQLGLARLGDVIETTIKYPVERVVRMRLVTPESCAYANELLMNKIGGWRLVRQNV